MAGEAAAIISPAPPHSAFGQNYEAGKWFGLPVWMQDGCVSILWMSHPSAFLLLDSEQCCSWLWARLILSFGWQKWISKSPLPQPQAL